MSLHEYMPLSRRQNSILLMVAEGMTITNIAQELMISVPTVKKHYAALLLKLDARTLANAVAQAYHYGVLTPRIRA